MESRVKIKTRNNSEHKDKNRVYFACHPDDFEISFDKITDKILEKQNCAIYYGITDKAMKEDESIAVLLQMQLIVIPITEKFLREDNGAYNIVFKIAIENHIPVLPIMQEENIGDLFNEKCGKLHYLKETTETTEISYDEKIESFLNSVLVNDEIVEKIRDAFAAYIFLSYRKKDRKYAQELMRLIHKNDFCRDIAIWYDEFLTPGENFNDSIKEAIKKSGLFVLAVTPNLINETNYVMTTEYPMAKREGKLILPTELVPTDRKALAKKYSDIPTPIDINNDIEFSDALLDSVKKIEIKKNVITPEHNFFIGLAYLDGIDMEIDHARALALITSAAEEQLVEAMKKLISMYKRGKGVCVDYIIALNWQYRLVNILFQKFNAEKTVAAFSEYFHELFNYVGDLYNERGDGPYELGASKVLEDCILYIDGLQRERHKELQEKFNKDDVLRECLHNDEMMNVLIESRQKLRFVAERFLPKTCDLYRELIYDKNQDKTPSQAVIRCWLSYFSEYAGDIEVAMQYRKEAENIIRDYASKDTGDVNELCKKCGIGICSMKKIIDSFR